MGKGARAWSLEYVLLYPFLGRIERPLLPLIMQSEESAIRILRKVDRFRGSSSVSSADSSS